MERERESSKFSASEKRNRRVEGQRLNDDDESCYCISKATNARQLLRKASEARPI